MIPSFEQQSLTATFPPAPMSARGARDFVRAGLHGADVHEPALTERLCLVASELVTNAILHARSDVEVRVVIDPNDVWLDVIDGESGRPCRAPPSHSDTSGRGLILVDALVDAWGVTDVEGGPGKRVWTRVSRCSDSQAHAVAAKT